MNAKKVSGYLTDAQKTKLNQFDAENKTNKLKKSQDMGRDQFLNLLMTQLSNQNPLEPLDNKDFIAQMAQFSSVESLSSIADDIEKVKGDIVDLKSKISSSDKNDKIVSQRELLEKISSNLEKLNKTQIKKINEMISAFKASGKYGA